jgi:hypothetical protein
LSALLLLSTSCEDYLDVNNNIDGPDYVDDYLYLSGIQQNLQDRYFDALYVTNSLTQMWSNTSQTSYASHYNPRATDTGALIWRTVYFNFGMNLENMINQAKESKRYTIVGIGYALKAYGWDMLTKLYADAPLKQAFATGLVRYDYDYQPEIYEQVREWAKTAIEYLEMEDNTVYGNQVSANDWIYQGDKAKWKKFAYGVLAHNLISLSNKSDFLTKYVDDVIAYANQSFETAADDALLSVAGGSQSAPYTAYNNNYGTARGNLTYTYQNDYAVQVMTGTVPLYNDEGLRVKREAPDRSVLTSGNPADTIQYLKDSLFVTYYPYELQPKQIICSAWKNWMWEPDSKVTYDATNKVFVWTPPANYTQSGDYDPRVVAKLATVDDGSFNNISNVNAVQINRFIGATSPTGTLAPNGNTVPKIYGRTGTILNGSNATPNDGKGRWIYHDEAPYVLMTCAEIKFVLAEAYFKKGLKDQAYAAWKEGVQADLDFTANQLRPGTSGQIAGGDKINKATFTTLATAYYNGPFVSGLGAANLTLSHIMMQKWVALYGWGSFEVWTDMRKYHYDISYSGDYPKKGDGWDTERWISMKKDDSPSSNKVYKGFYLMPTQNYEFRGAVFSIYNEGSPMYRIRPRYNSEEMWNVEKLELLKPISGMAENYHCSIPWFAYPGDYPESVE